MLKHHNAFFRAGPLDGHETLRLPLRRERQQQATHPPLRSPIADEEPESVEAPLLPHQLTLPRDARSEPKHVEQTLFGAGLVLQPAEGRAREVRAEFAQDILTQGGQGQIADQHIFA